MGWLTITVATQYVRCSTALATAILAVQFVPGYLLCNSFHFIFEYVNIVFPRVYSGAGVVTRVIDFCFHLYGHARISVDILMSSTNTSLFFFTLACKVWPTV